MKTLARKLLHVTEVLFLLAHGWRRDESGWYSPVHYSKRHEGIPTGHAVNSQKRFNDWSF